MTEISERYRRLAEQFTEKIESVPTEAWDRQSPCPEWTPRDLLRHVIDSSRHFLERAGAAPSDVPSVEDDPLKAWYVTRDAVQYALDEEQIAQRTIDSPVGATQLENLVNNYLAFDLVVHAWDIARATGIDERLDPQSVTEVAEQAPGMADQGRKYGAFGPEIEADADADDQTRLLAFLGRKA